MPSDITYENFFDHLLRAVPEYRPAYEADLRYYGEVIPHVFLGAFTAWLIDLATREPPDVDDAVRRAVTFLEDALANGDDGVIELVGVSFVENLAPPDQPGFGPIRKAMGPRLRAELRQQGLGD